MTRIFISAGESSGDKHAAELIKGLKKNFSNLEIKGIGGRQMQTQGADLIESLESLEVMGFVEVAVKLPFFFALKKRILNFLGDWKPDLVILVDYPGFNVSLAKKIKKYASNCKLIYYVSPQFWAWKKERARKLFPHIDLILLFFQFEVDFYKSMEFNKIKYIGYPAKDNLVADVTEEELRSSLNIDKSSKIIGLLPGSRKQEFSRLLNPFIEIATMVRERIKKIHCIIALAEGVSEKELPELPDFITFVKNKTYSVMKYSSFVLVASGTASLETSLFKTPNFVFYKMNTLNYYLIKTMIKVPYIAMSNLLVNEKIIPEYIQTWNTEEVAGKISFILSSEKELNDFKKKLERINIAVGEKGAIQRAANAISDILKIP
ncbi:MAG: lipid-A-disaccharide synthase [Candidatus Coatesbacteria bacterium]|nr:lipid-A-disaccharide synthase [Candidatus Coatesbacteria bacterium]